MIPLIYIIIAHHNSICYIIDKSALEIFDFSYATKNKKHNLPLQLTFRARNSCLS